MKRGDGLVPSFHYHCCKIMEAVKEKIALWLIEKLEEKNLFLVDIKILAGNNIQIFIDSKNGITVDICAGVSRQLQQYFDAENFFSNDYSLEVSSPGIDQPFKIIKQYEKNIGREVNVLLTNGIKKKGVLLQADEAKILLEENMNKEKVQTEIGMEQIKNTKIAIKF